MASNCIEQCVRVDYSGYYPRGRALWYNIPQHGNNEILIHQQNPMISNRSHRGPTSYMPSEPIDLVYTWVNGTEPTFRDTIRRYTKIIDENRFHEKNELKYSLRSIEKFAPWLRHIYIITNGQIPAWLNLEHPRISIVSHGDICPPDLVGHMLPTFSSFVIETFIHRIPNLSQRFLYLNDDIFLGKPLYLDHMLSASDGLRIWNAWQLPNCADACPWRFIGDGTCDMSCYTEMCHYDGDDCANDEVNDQNGHYALVDDEQVKKIVLNSNGDVPDDYTFSDAPKIKVQRREKNTRGLTTRHSSSHTMIQKSNADHSLGNHFIDSLINSNFVLNEKYGFKERRMIAHVGFLLDRTVMKEMLGKFPKEFNRTRSHRLRNGKQSIQLSFFYYNFVMSEQKYESDVELFDKIDTDGSG